jgi:hypothetical protein
LKYLEDPKVDKKRIVWLLEQIADVDCLSDSVQQAVEHALEEYFLQPAGELIDELRDLADGGGPDGEWPAADREVFRRLAEQLNEVIDRAVEVAERAGEVAGDLIAEIDTNEFRKLAKEYECKIDWPEIARPAEDDEDDG